MRVIGIEGTQETISVVDDTTESVAGIHVFEIVQQVLNELDTSYDELGFDAATHGDVVERADRVATGLGAGGTRNGLHLLPYISQNDGSWVVLALDFPAPFTRVLVIHDVEAGVAAFETAVSNTGLEELPPRTN